MHPVDTANGDRGFRVVLLRGRSRGLLSYGVMLLLMLLLRGYYFGIAGVVGVVVGCSCCCFSVIDG